MNQVKDFIEYIFNAIKIWIIIQPWQSGLRVRRGKTIKKLEKGIHFRIPYFDSIYVQEKRLRVIEVPIQTCTTKDQKTITLKAAIGYSIKDIEKVYETLYHPETSILNIVMSDISSLIWTIDSKDLDISSLNEKALKNIKEKDFGINFEYFKITNFALVRTYRLIQDSTYSWEGLKMDDKK